MKVHFVVMGLSIALIGYANTSPMAGGIVSLETPDWLPSVSAERYSKLHPGKRYPENYHETKDGKLSFYSEIDRPSEKKTILDIHTESVALQNEMFADVLSWNRKGIVNVAGKEFSLLDYNVKDPDGDEEFTFRMIVLDGIVDDQISHTVITIHDKGAENLYVEKLYSWLGLK